MKFPRNWKEQDLGTAAEQERPKLGSAPDAIDLSFPSEEEVSVANVAGPKGPNLYHVLPSNPAKSKVPQVAVNRAKVGRGEDFHERSGIDMLVAAADENRRHFADDETPGVRFTSPSLGRRSRS